MIVRLWRGRADGAGAPAYRAHFESAVRTTLARIPGFREASLLERPIEDGVEFLVLTEWESWEAVRAFAGDRPEV
ncbi:MAG: antibiotic biosynthesis monooxygenase, partial [Vicinamibacterales bacterium]